MAMTATVPATPSPPELVPIDSLVSRPPFSVLFPISDEIKKAITISMRTEGFRSASPIRVWVAPDKPDLVIVIDGHTRLLAAKAVKLTSVPILPILGIATEREALDWAIHAQRDRRNLTKKELLIFITRAVEAYRPHIRPLGYGSPNDPRLTTGEVAKRLGAPRGMVQQIRTVLDSDNPTLKKNLMDGKVAVNSAASQVAKERKELREKLALSGTRPKNDGSPSEDTHRQKKAKLNAFVQLFPMADGWTPDQINLVKRSLLRIKTTRAGYVGLANAEAALKGFLVADFKRSYKRLQLIEGIARGPLNDLREAIKREGLDVNKPLTLPLPPKSDPMMQLLYQIKKDLSRVSGCSWGRLQGIADQVNYHLRGHLEKLEEERAKPVVLP